jgi:hypothetical protein
MKKFLLALQYWEGDKSQAGETIKLIADLEEKHNPEVDVLLSCRFDCKHDGGVVSYVRRKFDTYTHVGRRRGVGWPAGCNDLFWDTVTRIYELCHAKKLPQYSGILTFEPDCSPIRPGWLELLYADWSRAKVKFMGNVVPAPAEHLNGNMVMSGDIDLLRKMATKILGCAPSGGWDFLLAPVFKQAGWYGTNTMRSEWARSNAFTAGELEEQIRAGLLFHHGMKNDSLQKLVRDKWLPRRAPLKKA